jgi:Mn-dependent DtxR family transcriptional regulator
MNTAEAHALDHALDASVLRAMLRLARRRQPADDGEIAVRVDQPPHAVRASLRRLDDAQLVERQHHGTVRLTMAGFALAVAGLPRAPGRSRPSHRAPRAA